MHLRNCEPESREKENAENISRIAPNLSAPVDFINEMLRDIAPPGGTFAISSITLVVAYNYIKTVHDGN